MQCSKSRLCQNATYKYFLVFYTCLSVIVYNKLNIIIASHKGEKTSFRLAPYLTKPECDITAFVHLTFASHYHCRDGMFCEVNGLVARTALILPMLGVLK